MSCRIRLCVSLAAAALVGCGPVSDTETPAVSVVVLADSSLAARFDSLGGADTLLHRAVLRVDSLPHNGTPGDARSLVTFTDSTTLEIPLLGAQLVLELPVEQRASWLLVSGVECSECDANLSLWVFRAAPGRVTSHPLSFAYPGEEFEAGIDSAPAFRSRLFVGRCLDARVTSAVWLEETLHPGSARALRIRVLQASPTLQSQILLWDAATEARIFARVSAGTCREIPGVAQYII